jgi:hypothetical protein
MRRILVIDTSILCVWLQVPGKETCGHENDHWNKQRIDAVLKAEEARGTILVLPLATIIETGNHIAQAKTRRYETARALADLMIAAADERSPWAAFIHQAEFWSPNGLRSLATRWPDQAKAQLSIGDATIVTVAEYYARMGNQVEILTGDTGLKQYQPSTPIPVPRRRRR